MYYVYILLSIKNNKPYVGYTSKMVKERLDEHNVGTNKWTRNNGPFKLLYYESYYCKKDAIHRENFLKGGVGKKLVKIIKENF
ncbi:excinuclease ABC subunit C [bacterium (Candidatus Howlettbacteria) CG_4_10_14_0_8_um_filter_40_9]|nr:MAG: excinuclease ABC subunit C [bacterium (Candidatus Howlettbacteria) CG_4_10_14_0_8_um_filter_40_9]